MSSLSVRRLTAEDAASIVGWRYDGPWAVYDVADIDVLTGELDDYSAIVDRRGDLKAFFCTGSAARAPGLESDPRYVDVGIGLDPAIVGKGRGEETGRLILRHLGERQFRAVVQAWNERSLRLACRLGFVELGAHRVSGVDFVVLVSVPPAASER